MTRDPHTHASWCHEECSAYVCDCREPTPKPSNVISLRAARQAAGPRVERPCDSEPETAA